VRFVSVHVVSNRSYQKPSLYTTSPGAQSFQYVPLGPVFIVRPLGSSLSSTSL
jgi:hypothetical protein